MAKTGSQWVGKSHLNWSDISHYIQILARRVRDTRFEFDKIATISRGGLVPARLMADQFDIKKILVDKSRIPSGTLFVDDIYDSGKTFKKVTLRLEKPGSFLYATLVARNNTDYPTQLVYARKTRGMEYVVFPWENKEYRRHGLPRDKNGAGRKPKNN